METAVTARGRFLWYDLLTSDPAAAHEFYRSVIGWGTQDWDGAPEGQTYTMWMAGETPIGGSLDSKTLDENPPPPHWLTHIGTDDLDQTIADAEANGGTVLSPARQMDQVGRFAPIRDPQGGVFMAYEPANAEPMLGPPTVGHASWNELSTTDQSGGLAFYQKLFGWNKGDAVDMGPDGLYQMFDAGQWPIGGIFPIGDKPMPTGWTPYFKVGDLDAAVERARARGGTILAEPMEVPGGDRVAVCADPQGAVFGMHEAAASSG
jgi:predicted enzyme related to lactoylglutathione lyase